MRRLRTRSACVPGSRNRAAWRAAAERSRPRRRRSPTPTARPSCRATPSMPIAARASQSAVLALASLALSRLGPRRVLSPRLGSLLSVYSARVLNALRPLRGYPAEAFVLPQKSLLDLRVSAVCLLSDFGLAGWWSLSLGAWVPSAAPDHARTGDHGAADSCLALSGGGRRARRVSSPTAGLQQRGEQSDLFYDYRTNVASYPAWRAWLRQHHPATLVIWGQYDPSFQAVRPRPIAGMCRTPRTVSSMRATSHSTRSLMKSPRRPVTFSTEHSTTRRPASKAQ